MRNELGTGVIDAATEQRLIVEGYTYAQRVFHADGSFHLRLCKGNIHKAAASLLLSAIQLNNTTNTIQREITL